MPRPTLPSGVAAVALAVASAAILAGAYTATAGRVMAEILDACYVVTEGSGERLDFVFCISGVEVAYSVRVKEPPWFAKVYVALMSYYDYGYGGVIVGGAIGKATAWRDVGCWWPGRVVGYYVKKEVPEKEDVTQGEYWVWEGRWKLWVKKDRCLWPDSDLYKGTLSLYAVRAECWGPLCG